jgi:hypothetical protein
MKLKIESVSRLGAKVIVDDTNIASMCNDISVRFRAGNIPEAILTLIPKSIEVDSDVNLLVKIGDKVYKLVDSEESTTDES